jgi:2-amino-4-hydroxy-6-hydroxymethyldihydropteridine diphosphokinase
LAERIFLSLGSNLGDREKNLFTAFKRLSSFCVDLRLSSIFQTAPLYLRDQPDFLNAVAEGYTLLAPSALLLRLQEIEADLGRDRSREVRMGPRTIDLDMLLYGGIELETADLTIPHPRMAERAFVLVPLLELAPELKDPVTGKPYADALSLVGRRGVYSYPLR